VDLRRLNRPALVHENGLDAQRLLPWAGLNAPFEGSWCVLAPGAASTPHAHHEYEIFIAVTGRAVLRSEGEEREFAAGDVVSFQPGTTHQVANESGQVFEMYSIWWDAAMTERFTARHEAGQVLR
jgi:mannose-6-phosphate isomerase-like protein (cupin superfamily)